LYFLGNVMAHASAWHAVLIFSSNTVCPKCLHVRHKIMAKEYLIWKSD
jgi:hypothetical protein